MFKGTKRLSFLITFLSLSPLSLQRGEVDESTCAMYWLYRILNHILITNLTWLQQITDHLEVTLQSSITNHETRYWHLLFYAALLPRPSQYYSLRTCPPILLSKPTTARGKERHLNGQPAVYRRPFKYFITTESPASPRL